MVEHRLHFEIARNEIGNEPSQNLKPCKVFKPIILLIEFYNRCFQILVEIEIKRESIFLFIIIRKYTFFLWCY